jgi:hypothetical protein
MDPLPSFGNCPRLFCSAYLVRPTEHAPSLRQTFAIGVQALRLALDKSLLWLLERDAQALHTHGWSFGAIRTFLEVVALRNNLDLVLAFLLETVRDNDYVFAVERGNHLIPVRNIKAVLPERGVGLVIQRFLDRLQQLRDLGRKLRDWDRALLARISATVAHNA